jgi:hypothetical protein
MVKRHPTAERSVKQDADVKPSAAAHRPSSLLDKAGRPDIDSFGAVMIREECDTGFFVSFDFTEDTYAEIGAFIKRTGKTIRALTATDILDEANLGMKLA